MKRYIQPNTNITFVELQQIMAGSTPGIDPTDSTTPEGSDAKGVGFFTAEETAEKNEYPAYSLWED